MNAKRLFLALLVALAFFVSRADACTIFVLTDGNRVLFCNNEDWSNPKSRMWFVPAGKGHLGCAYVGFDMGWAQGGVNTEGLAFDWIQWPMGEWKPDTDLKVVRGNPSARMLETCTTVGEAVAFFREHREPSFAFAKLLVADRAGQSVILSIQDGKLQVDETNQCRGFGYGQRTLDKMLATPPEPTAANGESILRACLQHGDYGTKYSNIFDLKPGDIHLFPNSQPSDGVKLNLAAELGKGEHYYDIPQASQQVTRTPKRLLNNMKRLFMNQFAPIPDAEPQATKRNQVILQNLLDGDAQAQDYTAEFWKEIERDGVRSIAEFKLLGKIASFTLVERKREGGQRSDRYHVEIKGAVAMEIQLRFDLDQMNKVAFVELEGAQWK